MVKEIPDIYSCPGCGYEFDIDVRPDVCPECGATIPIPGYPADPQEMLIEKVDLVLKELREIKRLLMEK